MFKISDFSKLSRIPMKTLRYYDQIGLLKPAKIDESSGYRYYAAEQLLTINRIVIFKELGFTLTQIAQLLQDDISSEQIRGMLTLKESEVQRQLELELSKLSRLKERMQLVEREGTMDKEQEVVLKRVESMRMVAYAARGTTQDIPSLFDVCERLLGGQARSVLTGPRMVLWDVSDESPDQFDFEAGYAIRSELLLAPESLAVHALPAELMATMLFRSDSVYAETACLQLAEWIEQQGYRVRGDQPGREIYVPLPDADGVNLIEIQIPIEEEEAL
ncbi:MerR family transcriptional regulator [Paenibacillus sp. 598K]|uniref:MerR family transcriptional regulator n=1 Tax=Paenibacillus sp. 598K TaxID=1117987 RepID=UPI000FFE816A|nr:MerR family transcriptional regulator [Paenibacillus sp. 598K]